MRQHHTVERRQVVQGHRRVDQPARPGTVAQVNPAAGGHEIGVGQQRERPQPQQRRRIADERDFGRHI